MKVICMIQREKQESRREESQKKKMNYKSKRVIMSGKHNQVYVRH